MNASLCTDPFGAGSSSEAVPADAVRLTGDLGDGPLRVVLLGTAAGPYPAPGRQGAATAVVVGDRVYLVDAGYGALRKYAQAGLALRDLGGVFVTHLHSDHVADLFNLLLLGWGPANRGVDHQVRIVGPGPDPRDSSAGTAGLVEHGLSAFGQDIGVRTRTSPRTHLAKLVQAEDVSVESTPTPVYEDDRIRVLAAAVPHPPLHLALGFRIETEHGAVAFSGDTARSRVVAELAASADILVHEVMDPTYYRDLGYSPELLDFLAASHTSPQEVGQVAAEAGVECVALSHIGPPDPRAVTDDDWERPVRAGFRGRIVVGHDLTRILPTRS
ncbi:Ribonuclease BN, tRNA processing enzyme [Saccharopolyspora antimicrobica]|uniref:Ribonuclease BN (tRNA processing enzyme) n=1 Tax=Saccharopolyspora antimicrobica TaxID=455193 RepID=A0A1I4VZP4_9PSEU|nr:MBL fold metallo-hydrolase [Saccharopolyspora antimicrobica]RKT87140.1 ribonuclease BN (tRNA processing enzyme) [Saccharopolyspora antimicrobica]SFN06650.1 Ribonuclease BN, tRNA processing enzyme [Saccharopolyspora antimicrobica]